jgi:hypothetical protein
MVLAAADRKTAESAIKTSYANVTTKAPARPRKRLARRG